MATEDLATSIADLLDRSRSDVTRRLSQLDADDIINIKVALDDQDSDLVKSILDQTEEPVVTQLDPRETLREINRVGRKQLELQQPMDRVWELIGQTKADDWRMMWPAVDENVMISLHNEATDSDTDSVTADQSQEIYNYARQFVSEHAVYQGQLVEVTIARGPNNTVGIKLNGKTTMVNRKHLQMLDEHVLGMTAMPSLGRIKQLAGIRKPVQARTSSGFEDFVEQQLKETPHEVQQRLEEFLHQVEEIRNLLDSDADYDRAIMHCAAAKQKLNRLMSALEQMDL